MRFNRFSWLRRPFAIEPSTGIFCTALTSMQLLHNRDHRHFTLNPHVVAPKPPITHSLQPATPLTLQPCPPSSAPSATSAASASKNTSTKCNISATPKPAPSSPRTATATNTTKTSRMNYLYAPDGSIIKKKSIRRMSSSPSHNPSPSSKTSPGYVHPDKESKNKQL